MINLCDNIIKFKDIIVDTDEKINTMEFLQDDCVNSTKIFHTNNIIDYPTNINQCIIPWKIIMWRVCCSI